MQYTIPLTTNTSITLPPEILLDFICNEDDICQSLRALTIKIQKLEKKYYEKKPETRVEGGVNTGVTPSESS